MRRATPLGTIALAAAFGCAAPGGDTATAAGVRAALDECADLAGDAEQVCYETRLLAELEASGVRPALDMLSAIAASDVDVQRDAHVFTHAIGIEAYDPGRSVGDVFSECTELFQSGCYHGVVQAHFMARGSVDEAGVRELCEGFKGPEGDRFLLFQCLHGLGHGLTMIYGHHLPRALEGCDFLEESWDRESCYGGAFMENVVAATDPHHAATRLASEADPAGAGGEPAVGGEPPEEHGGEHPDESAGEHEHGMTLDEGLEPFEPLRADDPHYPCSILEDRYLTACYMMQTSAMLQQNGTDVAAAAENCSEAPERWRRTCFQSLGRDVSSITLQDVGDSIDECRKAPEAYRGWCYVGVVKNFIDLTATTDDGFEFCRAVEDEAKPRCNEAIGEQVYVLFGTARERREACEDAEDEDLRRSCLRGARVPIG